MINKPTAEGKDEPLSEDTCKQSTSGCEASDDEPVLIDDIYQAHLLHSTVLACVILVST